MVTSVEELEIINELVNELNLSNLTSFSGGYNFSCPLCNEGSSPWKKRAYILFDDGSRGYNTFLCHNCYGDGMWFRNFVRLASNDCYKKYVKFEKDKRLNEFKKTGKFNSKKTVRINKFTTSEPKYIFKLSEDTFVPLRYVRKAVDYARSRKIPEHIIDTLKYSKPIEGWPYGNMLIFPLYYNEEEVYGFQGRDITTKKFRTFTKNDSFKVYGFYQVDHSKPVYVFESIIDSFAIPNSIAMLGADLSKNVRDQLKRPIFVFDNDRTGVEKAIKYLKRGEKVFIWPEQLSAKDTNDLILKGITAEQIKQMIDNNIEEKLAGLARAIVLLQKFKPTFRRKNNASI